MSKVTPPDQLLLIRDLGAPEFRSRELDGHWRLIELVWPHAMFAVSAAERPNSPVEYSFRFECTGYPQTPPAAQLWDLESNSPVFANQRPLGKGLVSVVFRMDWEGGKSLYLPCERVAINSHPDWRTQHPSRLWNPPRGIVCYLEQLYDILNSNDYTGASST